EHTRCRTFGELGPACEHELGRRDRDESRLTLVAERLWVEGGPHGLAAERILHTHDHVLAFAADVDFSDVGTDGGRERRPEIGREDARDARRIEPITSLDP